MEKIIGLMGAMREEIALLCERMTDKGEETVAGVTFYTGLLQGLSRYNDATQTEAEFLVVEMARLQYGKNWLPDFLHDVSKDGIEHVLV